MTNTATTRCASIERKTKETKVALELNLDGVGNYEIETGVPFFNHLLEAFAKHSRIDLRLAADGDIEVDAHHTVEDTGIVLGEAIAQALGDKAGIRRFADASVPLDEALVFTAVDLSGRATLVYEVPVPIELIGSFDTTLFKEFCVALSNSLAATMHIHAIQGENAHHILEAAVKSLAIALGDAVAIDPRLQGNLPSTKGLL